jgi:para-nitrobenzyl esterase
LQWVRDNIAAFGGDPGNVTIFGESGGGGKVCTLLGTPAAKGLFHKAIVESGSLLRIRELAAAKTVASAVYRELNIKEGDVAALRRVPTRQLLAASERFSATLDQVLTFGPVADGVVISGQPWRNGLPEQARGIPVIVGTNHHEAATFIGADLAKPIANDDALAATAATAAVVETVTPQQARAVLPVVRATMPNASDREVLVRLATDLGFWKAAVRQCELTAAAKSAPVFAYECRWETPCFGGMWSPHGIELPFILDHRNYAAAWDGTDTDAQRQAADPQGIRFQVGRRMLEAWAGFAHTGNPSTPALTWPAYETGERRTMVFDRASGVVADPRPSIREAVAAI